MAHGKVFKFVLTGGPCGGKTTSLSHISSHLKSLGFEVYVLPETATLLIGSGVQYHGLTREQQLAHESSVIRFQRASEDAFVHRARQNDKPTVLLCDRGVCDERAYMNKDDFNMLLDQEQLKLGELRDRRYDAVYHLVSAAIGAEKFYTNANNEARTETVDEAKELDHKTLEAWLGHPRLHVIDNSTDFETKIARVTKLICVDVGKEPKVARHKYLVISATIPSSVSAEVVTVESIFLSEEKNIRVIKRSQQGSSTYSVKEYRGQLLESYEHITAAKFLEYSVKQSAVSCVKKKTNFIWNHHHYSLQEYQAGCITLTVGGHHDTSADHPFPPFIAISKDITDNSKYSCLGMAYSCPTDLSE